MTEGRQGRQPDGAPPRWGIKTASAPYARRAKAEWEGRTGQPPPEFWENIYAAAFAAALNPDEDALRWEPLRAESPRFAPFALDHANRMVDALSDRALCEVMALSVVPPLWMKLLTNPMEKVEAHLAAIVEAARRIRPTVPDKAARNAWEKIRREQRPHYLRTRE